MTGSHTTPLPHSALLSCISPPCFLPLLFSSLQSLIMSQYGLWSLISIPWERVRTAGFQFSPQTSRISHSDSGTQQSVLMTCPAGASDASMSLSAPFFCLVLCVFFQVTGHLVESEHSRNICVLDHFILCYLRIR